jgi:anhydro-N-acetylmuramic acid kinase
LKKNGRKIAFDIAPVNIVLNRLAQKFNKNFDENGDLARKGRIHDDLLTKLNSLDFYSRPHPKSLGIEWCNESVFPLLEEIKTEDAIATFTEHVAQQISNVINLNHLQNVLCTGGGSYNTCLIEKIREKTEFGIIIPERGIIDYKEALIFAFMGVLRMNNEINVLASATDSTADHSSGIIA